MALLASLSISEGAEVETEGPIDTFVSATEFRVNGIPITTNTDTEYEDGSSASLALDVKVEVEGVANASGVGMRLVFDRVPVLESAYHYAQLGTFPGGAFDNRAYFQKHVRYSRSITEVQEMLLYDPQTSGGLLLAVPVQALPDLQEKAARVDQPMWEIGEVTDDIFIEIV